jgi:serine/threonine-protein kinase
VTEGRAPDASDAESLLPKDWADLSPLVDAVLDAPPDRRQILIAELAGGDAVRQAALERLVAECEHQDALLNRPAAERFAELLELDEAPPPDMLGGKYRIERELGRGGMARVYLAHDVKHARDVAVKVIRPELAASLGRARFLREIAIAARLRHPNIVPLYDSGDADGVLYFVMPYEEGPSLRAHLDRSGALPLDECVSTLRDVARALAYAHERGVVHRDVKPDNVMLSGGAAVVTDFGIAKAIAAAAGGDRSERDGARDPRQPRSPSLGLGWEPRRTWRPNKPSATRPRITARTSTRSAVWRTSCSSGTRRFATCRCTS